MVSDGEQQKYSTVQKMGPFWKNCIASTRKEKITDTKDVKVCCKERKPSMVWTKINELLPNLQAKEIQGKHQEKAVGDKQQENRRDLHERQ